MLVLRKRQRLQTFLVTNYWLIIFTERIGGVDGVFVTQRLKLRRGENVVSIAQTCTKFQRSNTNRLGVKSIVKSFKRDLRYVKSFSTFLSFKKTSVMTSRHIMAATRRVTPAAPHHESHPVSPSGRIVDMFVTRLQQSNHTDAHVKHMKRG